MALERYIFCKVPKSVDLIANCTYETQRFFASASSIFPLTNSTEARLEKKSKGCINHLVFFASILERLKILALAASNSRKNGMIYKYFVTIRLRLIIMLFHDFIQRRNIRKLKIFILLTLLLDLEMDFQFLSYQRTRDNSLNLIKREAPEWHFWQFGLHLLPTIRSFAV